MKNFYILQHYQLVLMLNSTTYGFLKYDNLIVELGDNKYESSIIRSYEDTINLRY